MFVMLIWSLLFDKHTINAYLSLSMHNQSIPLLYHLIDMPVQCPTLPLKKINLGLLGMHFYLASLSPFSNPFKNLVVT